MTNNTNFGCSNNTLLISLICLGVPNKELFFSIQTIANYTHPQIYLTCRTTKTGQNKHNKIFLQSKFNQHKLKLHRIAVNEIILDLVPDEQHSSPSFCGTASVL